MGIVPYLQMECFDKQVRPRYEHARNTTQVKNQTIEHESRVICKAAANTIIE